MKNIFCKCKNPRILIGQKPLGSVPVIKYNSIDVLKYDPEYKVSSIECQKCGEIEEGSSLGARAYEIFEALEEEEK